MAPNLLGGQNPFLKTTTPENADRQYFTYNFKDIPQVKNTLFLRFFLVLSSSHDFLSH